MNQQWTKGPMIGRGSTATVHLALGSHSSDPFAVKSAELSRSADLLREQRVLSALDCPDIIAYLGYDISTEADGRRYYNLFMEHAAGGSLSDCIKKQGGRLDQQAIRSRTHEILSGLAYLHSRRIVHCDIKPQNILIGADGQAKIADFGCARVVDTEQVILGTPRFMAPEVARGEEQGLAADVWALGCTILEMATGAPAWAEVFDPLTVLHRIAFSTQVPEFPSWFSDEGRDFLDKCFRRDPNERWTVEQLIRHPFVADRSNRTPKSILDQDMWDAMSETEDCQQDEFVEELTDNETDRMNQLVTSEPNWIWDESWVTIRGDDREFETLDSSVQHEVETVGEDIALMAPAIPSTGVATSIVSTFGDEDMDNFITNVVTNTSIINSFRDNFIPYEYFYDSGNFVVENESEKGLSHLIVMAVVLCFLMELMLLEDKRPAYCFVIFSLLCFLLALYICHSLVSLLLLVQCFFCLICERRNQRDKNRMGMSAAEGNSNYSAARENKFVNFCSIRTVIFVQ